MKPKLKETQEWENTTNNPFREAEGGKKKNVWNKKEMKLFPFVGSKLLVGSPQKKLRAGWEKGAENCLYKGVI